MRGAEVILSHVCGKTCTKLSELWNGSQRGFKLYSSVETKKARNRDNLPFFPSVVRFVLNIIFRVFIYVICMCMCVHVYMFAYIWVYMCAGRGQRLVSVVSHSDSVSFPEAGLLTWTQISLAQFWAAGFPWDALSGSGVQLAGIIQRLSCPPHPEFTLVLESTLHTNPLSIPASELQFCFRKVAAICCISRAPGLNREGSGCDNSRTWPKEQSGHILWRMDNGHYTGNVGRESLIVSTLIQRP